MRLIDADALLDFIDVGHLRYPSELCFSEIDVANMLLHAPTVSPDEVRGVGKWDRVETEFGLRCPKCGKLLDEYVNGGEWVALSEIPNYCPNCGARLTGGEND